MGRTNVSVAVAARSKVMVRMISDALAGHLKVGKKEHGPIPHDVMLDQTQITLSARVVAFIMASRGDPKHETLAGGFE